MLKLTAYGTRGSIPTPSYRDDDGKLFSTDEFGGNTTCYLVQAANGKRHIVDAGSGIRILGLSLMKKGQGTNLEANLYITHTHWDHIQGFPFFVPGYIKGNKIDVYSRAMVQGALIRACEDQIKEGRLDVRKLSGVFRVMAPGTEEVLERQQEERNFPAPLKWMSGLQSFHDIAAGLGFVYEDEAVRITSAMMNHPTGCLAYKFLDKPSGKVLVVSSDHEPFTQHQHKIIAWDGHGVNLDDLLIDFWSGADLVVCDSQYERDSKVNPPQVSYGHSDPVTDIDFAFKAGVPRLIFHHFEPKMDDDYHHGREQRAQAYAHDKTNGTMHVEHAREGRSWIVGDK